MDNTRQSTGGEISQYSISPRLPVGLSINAQSGIISGTPSEAQGQTLFTVTGRNFFLSILPFEIETISRHHESPKSLSQTPWVSACGLLPRALTFARAHDMTATA
ncbi:Ig domain-containing protein [Paraburkholderia sp. Kb1A]|uniref:Ig domain-containing protein n=1 Tax=Paraburkholderia sp. Kb1A TaxID=2723096 RepID=UPI00288B2DC4|nr:Ig domain-containing protein [Paraburkholderia sp. Kb1A]